LRIDFTFDRKLTPEEKEAVTNQVNEWIEQDLEIIPREMNREDAEQIGAEMEFGARYPDTVTVYFIEDTEGNVISKEFCGGPHIKRTSELGKFRIKKEESSSAGVRRIKGILE
jgi:alanyl-tRNA synthetase